MNACGRTRVTILRFGCEQHLMRTAQLQTPKITGKIRDLTSRYAAGTSKRWKQARNSKFDPSICDPDSWIRLSKLPD